MTFARTESCSVVRANPEMLKISLIPILKSSFLFIPRSAFTFAPNDLNDEVKLFRDIENSSSLRYEFKLEGFEIQ